ncbi:MAG: hypothetical protein JWQ87_4807 [Candidatus Sulfotelmatobacter sp.]|nr:hypothetical protein [Candidatus Sulfotelmatobacter sp.]
MISTKMGNAFLTSPILEENLSGQIQCGLWRIARRLGRRCAHFTGTAPGLCEVGLRFLPRPPNPGSQAQPRVSVVQTHAQHVI